MKTIEEILKKHIAEFMCVDMNDINHLEDWENAKVDLKPVFEAMQEYAKQMCEQQRELCADALPFNTNCDISEFRIEARNAPLATDNI